MDSNSRFLMRKFRDYYKTESPILPDRFTRREFGFMFFDKTFVQRHICFSNHLDLQKYMRTNVPAHSYYSTAYYRRPDAPTMEEKEWMGAELIFDLDADHLEGAENLTFEQMLEQIRKEMITLVDTYLLGDMGFSDKDVEIVFSGGRGYHAHVKIPEVTRLGSHERREIVDYVTSRGLDIDWIFPIEYKSLSYPGDRYPKTLRYRQIPPAESKGWKLRLRNGLKQIVEDLCSYELPELKKMYPSLSKKTSIAKAQTDLKKSKESMFENNKMVNLDQKTQEILIEILSQDIVPKLSGEVDEPVTADIKRLIRLPGSIHGKSGLKVMPLTRDELSDFDPMISAVPDSYSDELLQITMFRDTTISMKGETFKLSGTTEVPEYLAIFLIGKKMATLGDGTPKKDGLF